MEEGEKKIERRRVLGREEEKEGRLKRGKEREREGEREESGMERGDRERVIENIMRERESDIQTRREQEASK